MRRGPKPKPYLLKAAEGFRGHRPHYPGVELPAGPFEPPCKLDDVARHEWDRVLAIAHWIRETDSVALADRCLCFQRVVECERQIQKMGLFVKTEDGEKSNPLIKIAHFYRASMAVWDRELGLRGNNEWLMNQ
jgi:phage terminase small subunit